MNNHLGLRTNAVVLATPDDGTANISNLDTEPLGNGALAMTAADQGDDPCVGDRQARKGVFSCPPDATADIKDPCGDLHSQWQSLVRDRRAFGVDERYQRQ